MGGTAITAPNVVIAAGSRPRIPEIPGLAGTPYLTSDTAMRLESQPHRLVILGGGFVAAELAHFFGALGTEVTIVQRSDRLLTREDDDVSAAFTKEYGQKFDLCLNSSVKQVRHDGVEFQVTIEQGGETAGLVSDALLVAIGRVPNTDTLDLRSTGVELDDRGFVRSDEFLQTNVEGIWTLGDIAGHYMLRHNANLEAEHVAHNLLDPKNRVAVDHHAMPHAVFASPQVAATGLTEREARASGRPYLVGRAEYAGVAYGMALRDDAGFVKAIVDGESGEVLGCHIMGTDASILIQEAANLMRQRLPYDAFAASVYVHPALPEVMQSAFGSLHSHQQ